jgi:hypothetical protein
MNCTSLTSVAFGLKGGKSSVTLEIGSELAVSLETKAGSTGFDWYLVGEVPPCLAVSEPTFSQKTVDGKSIPGASSMKQIIFKPQSVCQGTLIFKYFRSWESPSESSPVVEINVSVSESDGL